MKTVYMRWGASCIRDTCDPIDPTRRSLYGWGAFGVSPYEPQLNTATWRTKREAQAACVKHNDPLRGRADLRRYFARVERVRVTVEVVV